MARRSKHSTALFEVIKVGTRDQFKPLAASPRTRRGWFFGRADRPAATPATPEPISKDPNDPTARVTAASLMAHRPAVVVVEPVVEIPGPPPPAAVEPTPIQIDIPAADAAFDPDPEVAAAPFQTKPEKPLTSRSGMRLAVNHHRQELTLRMRYTSAVVTIFTVMVTIGLAYVIGRRMTEGPTAAKASEAASNLQPNAGAQSSVLNPTKVAKTSPRANDPFSAAANNGKASAAKAPATAVVAATKIVPDSPMFSDAKVINGAARRTVGLNYLMITSYPPELKSTAYEVANTLVANGVACTVEKSTQKIGAHADWYCVIGTRGFPRGYGENQKYKDYLKDIASAAKRFPSKSKFDRLQPMAFKWIEG